MILDLFITITLCILVIQKYQEENTLYQNSKHETKDAEYHELQELFHMLHINSIEKLRKSYRIIIFL